jgi:hypothetical protein
MGRRVTAGRESPDALTRDLVNLCVNTLRMLSIDTLQQAASPPRPVVGYGEDGLRGYVLMREFGFTPEHVVETAKAVESAEER